MKCAETTHGRLALSEENDNAWSVQEIDNEITRVLFDGAEWQLRSQGGLVEVRERGLSV
jgi:hypothetical protein